MKREKIEFRSIPARIYYRKSDGKVLVKESEELYTAVVRDKEADQNNYVNLSQMNLDAYDFIDLEMGQHKQEFEEGYIYKVDMETKELVFNYDKIIGEDEEEEDDVYRLPISEQLEEIKARQEATEMALIMMMEGGM